MKTPTTDRRAYDIHEVAAMYGLSESAIRALITSGALKALDVSRGAKRRTLRV